jgi:hypothetical protein
LYKACQQGEGFAPGSIEVVPGADPHYPTTAPARAVRTLQSWCVDGQFAALAIVERRTPAEMNNGRGASVQTEPVLQTS